METNNKINKINIILEYTWLGVAVFSVIAGVHQTYYEGTNKSWLFFVITFIAILMYWIRRTMRKNMKKK